MNRSTADRAVRVFAAGALLAASSSRLPAIAADPGIVKSLQSLQFAPDDDVKCLADALEAGDPAKGPSAFLLKAPPGCVVPWHYHTAMEQATVVRGEVRMEMTGHSAVLGPGGFAEMPGKMPHQFSCAGKQECLIMVTFDAAYDIFWGKGR